MLKKLGYIFSGGQAHQHEERKSDPSELESVRLRQETVNTRIRLQELRAQNMRRRWDDRPAG